MPISYFPFICAIFNVLYLQWRLHYHCFSLKSLHFPLFVGLTGFWVWSTSVINVKPRMCSYVMLIICIKYVVLGQLSLSGCRFVLSILISTALKTGQYWKHEKVL